MATVGPESTRIQPQERADRMVELLRQGQDTFLTTKADSVFNWARKYSMFLYPFVTACCGMEFMSAAGPRYDIDRFGCALPRFSPRQADLLMVVGTITHRQAPILKKVYDQMAEPKWVYAFGACVCSGGPYNNYATVQGIDTTVLGALYHVVEHFSGHTAQIAWITKMRMDEDLGFYRIDPDGRVHTTWNQGE